MTTGPGGADRRAEHPVAAMGLAVVMGLLAAATVGAELGVVVGLAAGGCWYSLVCRRRARVQARQDRRVTADLPFTVDLLAAALRAGASPESAVREVASVLNGPVADRLARVARALHLGASTQEAWAHLGQGDGVARMARAAGRSQHSGAAFASSLQRLAEDLRTTRLLVADAAARRAGVLIVLPLGLCFLPAFVLAGLVPVIVAVLGDVLAP